MSEQAMTLKNFVEKLNKILQEEPGAEELYVHVNREILYEDTEIKVYGHDLDFHGNICIRA